MKLSLVLFILALHAAIAKSPPDDYRVDTWNLQRSFPYADIDGGVWKQGFPITFDEKEFGGKTVNVFVVPWSHNDPGWRLTYGHYFSTQSTHILDNVVSALNGHPGRRFMWAESCILQRWYVGASEAMRSAFRRAVKAGQLEVVTGGWVMTDEAAAHYEPMVEQLAEGHDWLMRAVGIRPRTAWSCDPFGHSPVFSYILSRAGFDGAVINRIHYAVKKELASNKAVEFLWRPHWQRASPGVAAAGDNNGDEDNAMLTHVLPFFAYDIPHTCGPNPKVCARFDFTMVGQSTLWGDAVEAVTDSNVARLASALADQYRQKAMLFRTNNVLVPLGYDFSYVTASDLETQFNSYQKLFDVINSDPKSHLRVAFSNLSSWLHAVKSSPLLPPVQRMPVIRGDFFPYSDLRKDYWSGYFTSRPFFKKLSRALYSTTRATQALFTLLTTFGREPADKDDLPTLIQRARRIEALFQHHDAITGTSAKAVVRDYGRMLHDARWEMKLSLLLLIQHALSLEPFPDTAASEDFEVDEAKMRSSELPVASIIRIPPPEEVRPVVLFNPLPHTRTEMVTVLVDSVKVQVRDGDGRHIPSQICPTLDGSADAPFKLLESRLALTFPVTLPPLSLVTVFLMSSENERGAADEDVTAQPCTITTIRGTSLSWGKARPSTVPALDRPCISNQFVTACFDQELGTLASLGSPEAAGSVKFVEQFASYATTKSGPYIMNAEKPATVVDKPAYSVLTKGIHTEEFAMRSGNRHRVARVFRTTDRALGSFVELENTVHVTDGELVVRYTTDVAYEKRYVTDENGFGFSPRFWRPDMPISANFFPVTSTIYWQDKSSRVSIHVAQALAGTCSGESTAACELMLDRNAPFDDGKGLSDRMDDNVPTQVTMRVTLEPADDIHVEDSPTTSALSHVIATRMNHPVQRVIGKVTPVGSWTERFGVSVSPLAAELPEDVELIGFRTASSAINAGELTITLARHLTGRSLSPAAGDTKEAECIAVADAFRCAEATDIVPHTLTFLHEIGEDAGDEQQQLGDGLACLKQGTMHSFSFNLKVASDCQPPGMGAPRPSKWTLTDDGDPEDGDQKQPQQAPKQVETPAQAQKEEQPETDLPPGIPPEQAITPMKPKEQEPDEEEKPTAEEVEEEEKKLPPQPQQPQQPPPPPPVQPQQQPVIDRVKLHEDEDFVKEHKEVEEDRMKKEKAKQQHEQQKEEHHEQDLKRPGPPRPPTIPVDIVPTRITVKDPNRAGGGGGGSGKFVLAFLAMCIAVILALIGYMKRKITATRVVIILTAVCCLNAFFVLFSSFS